MVLRDLKTYKPIECESIDTPSGRFYITPDGNQYESVTTALGKIPGSKDFLEAWKARIGEEEARKQTKQAANRGTKLHSLLEDYLNGKEDCTVGVMPNVLFLFKQLQPLLDKYVTIVYLQEAALYSHKYRLAGRVDAVAMFGGKLSIIDFKTSSKDKKPEWVYSYRLQTAAYAAMFEEIYGVPIEQNVILIASDHGKRSCFIEQDIKAVLNEPFFTERLI